MNIKETIKYITTNRNLFIVKVFIRNHSKIKSGTLYFCSNHQKAHKYTFHSIINFAPGTERMYGFDSAKEVINFAKSLA